jgi:hypothetical protein
MTPKQIKLLSNLAEGPNLANKLVPGVVSGFRHASVFTPAHVIGSMLQQLECKGFCYHIRGPAKGKVRPKLWHITELGFNTMLNECASL